MSQHFQNTWNPETELTCRLGLEVRAGLLEKEGSVGVESCVTSGWLSASVFLSMKWDNINSFLVDGLFYMLRMILVT